MFEPVHLTTPPPQDPGILMPFWHHTIHILGLQYHNLASVQSILYVVSPPFLDVLHTYPPFSHDPSLHHFDASDPLSTFNNIYIHITGVLDGPGRLGGSW